MAGVVGMTASDDPVRTTAATDTRPPARGWGRVIIAVYAIFAISATARAGVQLVRDAGEAPLAYGLSAFAALVYVLATVALGHNGRRMRRIAWCAVVVELCGVLTVGLLSVLQPELFPEATVWSQFGRGYGFVPLVLPVLGIIWLWRSSPQRVVRASEDR